MHQPTASTPIGCVVQQGHTALQQQSHRIPRPSLSLGDRAILVAVRQIMEPLPAVAGMVIQLGWVLTTPWGGVAVLQHHPHIQPSPVTLHQGLGDAGQG